MTGRAIRFVNAAAADAAKLKQITLPDGHYLSVSYDETPNEDSDGEMIMGKATFPWIVQYLKVSDGQYNNLGIGSNLVDMAARDEKIEFVFLLDLEKPQFYELIKKLADKHIFANEDRGIMSFDEFLSDFVEQAEKA